MRICLISVEIFGWGKYGGFGRATRTIGRELAKRGHEVHAVVPRRPGQKPVEFLDGINVLGFPHFLPWTAGKLFRECDADIYHSCEPSFGSYMAMKTMPDRKHMVTVRDPRDFNDWRMEFDLPSLHKPQVALNYLYENSPLVHRCVRRMHAVFTIAKCLVPKVKRMYRLEHTPEFLPTPVRVPCAIEKAASPTVCYVARLDRRKRPDLFMELAKEYPHVSFIAMGKSRDPAFDARLRSQYGSLPNLKMVGFVDQFSSDSHSKVLEASWVMVNTATREALPNAFLEAAAHKCAILSSVDPDGFSSQFGYHARKDDFKKGLAFLLENLEWKVRGERGYEHVRATFELERAMDQHVAVYERLLAGHVLPVEQPA